MMTRGMWLGLVLGLVTACPLSKSECSSANDCATLVPGVNSNAPPQATKYCEGGACVDPPSGTTTLSIDLTAPLNVPVASIRFAVMSYKGAGVESSCKGKANCPAETVTCDDIKNEGLASSRFNVALGGVKGADTSSGNYLGMVLLGEIPQASQYLVVEGRSGQLGAGDRLAWYCSTVAASTSTMTQAVHLMAN